MARLPVSPAGNAFEMFHERGHAQFGRKLKQYMHMICLPVEFKNPKLHLVCHRAHGRFNAI